MIYIPSNFLLTCKYSNNYDVETRENHSYIKDQRLLLFWIRKSPQESRDVVFDLTHEINYYPRMRKG